MNNWQDLASTHSLQSLCEMAVRSIELQAQVRKLQAELSEQAHCAEPWKPSIGEDCLITFGGTKCKVLSLHQGQAAVSTGWQIIAVDVAQLTQAEGAENAKG